MVPWIHKTSAKVNKYGHKFTKFIKGMFTIVIYDMNINKVFIIRDEKGIKPLFYSFNNNK